MAGIPANEGSGKDQELRFRLSGLDKEKIKAAAAAKQLPASEYMRAVLLDDAERTLRRERETVLGDEAWAAFNEALAAPPKSIPALAELFRKKQVGEK